MALTIYHFPDREIVLNNTKYLYFGGTAYLGVQTNEQFQEIYTQNIKSYGTNYGASRISNVKLAVYEKAEKHLATWMGSEACISLSSGYLAGQLLASYYNNSAFKLFYAPNTHSALFRSKTSLYGSFEDLRSSICQHLALDNGVTPVILMDSIDFSGCAYPDFEGIQSIPLKDCILIVDDSHGIGIVGLNGGGSYMKLNELQPKDLIVCGSLGKSLGIQAGGIFTSNLITTELSNTNLFSGASPAAPAAMATLIQANSIYLEKRQRLARNISLFIHAINDLSNFKSIINYPSFGFSDTKLVDFLFENHIVVSDFIYPNEDSSVGSRIVITAFHTAKDLEKLCKTINIFYKK